MPEMDEPILPSPILLETILRKLPAPTRKRFEPLDWQKRYLGKLDDMTRAGIDARILDQFLDMRAGQTTTGRAWRVMHKTLTELDLLRMQHSAAALNAAMARTVGMNSPQKCTPQYVAAILRNTSETLPAASAPQPSPAAPMSPAEAWNGIMALLRQRVSESNWRTWLAPCQMIAATPAHLHIRVPNSTYVFWLTDHYTGLFKQAAAEIFGGELGMLEFEEDGDGDA